MFCREKGMVLEYLEYFEYLEYPNLKKPPVRD
jgi:hypothetical protein